MEMTRISAVFLLICLEVFPGNVNSTDFTSRGAQCLRELGLTGESVSGLILPGHALVEGNENVNKYVGCMWKKTGFYDESGQINTEVLEQAMGQASRDCISIVGTDAGDTAVKIFNCIQKKIQED